MIRQRLHQLKNEMRQADITVYIIPSSDFHQSEYTGEHFNAIEYMSGFTGSSGTLVVTREEAALFTDGRYFIQAEKQLSGTGIRLMKTGLSGTPDLMQYVSDKSLNGTVAFDGRVIDAAWGLELEEKLAKRNAKVLYEKDYVGEIWTERPALSKEKAFLLNLQYSGESFVEKLKRVRGKMQEQNAKIHIISSLDDICWLLNIRGRDVACNPVVLAFVLITTDQVYLFTDKEKFSEEMIGGFLKNGVVFKPYEDIYKAVSELTTHSVLLDGKRVNYMLYKKIPQNIIKIIAENPTVRMKAIKNPVEQNNLRAAHRKDGAAVVKFLYWLKNNIGKLEITEISAAAYLDACRAKQGGFIEPSFPTISAYNEHAAMMHYSAVPESDAVLKQEGLLLVDSGGQYYEGTTDITRTIALGKVSEEVKKHFTLVLKGMLNLAHARFLYGCDGFNLDIMARGALWAEGIDYLSGTGHGVGYLLNVHEAPNGFRWKRVPGRNDLCVFEEGMVTSDEPGIYIEGKYGIRTENELLCVKSEANEYGQFMKFETLTMAPVDPELIDIRYLEQKDIQRLNEYHKNVYEIISPHLEENEKKWLFEQTKEICN